MATETFGQTDNGTGSYGIGGQDGSKAGSIYTAPSGGELQKLTVRCWITPSGTYYARPVVYAVSGGAPGALLTYGDEVAITNTTEDEIDFPVTPIEITGSTDYFLGLHGYSPGSSNSFIFSRSEYATNNRFTGSDLYADGPSDPAGSMSTLSRTLDIWGTYEASGGGGPTLLNGFKVWDGSAWVVKPVKVYNDSIWEEKPLKRFDGSDWVAVEYEE